MQVCPSSKTSWSCGEFGRRLAASVQRMEACSYSLKYVRSDLVSPLLNVKPREFNK
jgi:hypothetical protein